MFPPSSDPRSMPGMLRQVQRGLAPTQAQAQATSADIRNRYSQQLEQLIRTNVKLAIDREKIFQYATARRNDFYYRGNQHLAPTFTGTGELVDFKPVNSQMLLKSTTSSRPNTIVYDYVINNFRGDIRKFVGVLGQKAPNVKSRPIIPTDDTMVDKTRMADVCAAYLRGQWDVDAANRYLTLSLAKNGTTFLHTRWVTDPDRYGTYTEPVWGNVQQPGPSYYQCFHCGYEDEVGSPNAVPAACPNCAKPLGPAAFQQAEPITVPQIIDERVYGQGTVELSIHSIFEITTPFYVKDLEHCPWLWKDGEEDQGVLLARFPDRGLEDRLNKSTLSTDSAGGSSSSLGKLARVQASSPTGYGMIERPNRWNLSEFWIRPSVYYYLLKQDAMQTNGEDSKQILQELRQRFPSGLKLTFVDFDLLVDVQEERLDEVWAAVKPETSEYLYADPIFNDYVQGADMMNDSWNMQIQLMETAIPAMLFDPDVLDPVKVRKGFSPNEFVPMIQGKGADASKSFYNIPTSDPKPALYEFNKQVLDILREIVGLMPAVFGGEGPAQTAEEARRRLNQALMVLATTWNEMRMGWTKAYRNGTRQLAKYSLGRLVSSLGDPQSVTVQVIRGIQTLLDGGYYYECDQAIPMNWTQLRDFIQAILTGPPAMAQVLGATDPDNLADVQQGIGLPSWKIPGLDHRNAVRNVISKLLEGQPTPSLLPGEPPTPTIQFNPLLLDPMQTMSELRNWFVSPEGQSEEGSPGHENVMAFAAEVMKILNPPLPPPGPGQPSPGGPPKPGGPPATQPAKPGPPPPGMVGPGAMKTGGGQMPPPGPEPPLANLPGPDVTGPTGQMVQ